MLVVMMIMYCSHFVITITIVVVAVAVIGVTITVVLVIVSVGLKVVLNTSGVDVGVSGQLI